MAMYLHLAKYTSEGMRAALAAGLSTRRAAYEAMVTAAGGTVHRWDLVADGDWDLAILDEFPDTFDHADSARFTAALRAGGALAELRTWRLATVDAFEQASTAGERAYRPPAA
jgi:uncharacterized protein with GYD domain